MPTAPPPGRSDAELLEANRRFYDALWTDARLLAPERFNTWPLVTSLVGRAGHRLEVAPGLRPRLPIQGTYFLDISPPAVQKLHARGARAVTGSITAIPFATETFDLVCALDIVEHVDDENRAFAELARVAAPNAVILMAMPLHPSRWTAFDELVGHRRRYEPERLVAKLGEHGLRVESSAAYGMQPRSPRLANLGMWWLAHRRDRAIWWYNHVNMPAAVCFEKKLTLAAGMIDARNVDEILMVCRKTGVTANSRSLASSASQ